MIWPTRGSAEFPRRAVFDHDDHWHAPQGSELLDPDSLANTRAWNRRCRAFEFL